MPVGKAEPARPGPRSSRVFISYVNESDAARKRVRDLADKLREQGVEAWIDQYVDAPEQGWPRWSEEQFAAAEFIVLICTAAYCERYLEPPSTVSRREAWEGQILRQLLVEAGGNYGRFIPVTDSDPPPPIPPPLGNLTVYDLEQDWERFYARVTHQRRPAPQLGGLRPIPPLAAKSSGAPEEIDWKSWIGLTARELLRLAWRRRAQVALTATVLVALAALVAIRWIRMSREGVQMGPPTRLTTCIEIGRKENRPYILESVVIIWHFRDVPFENPSRRELSVRTTYIVRPLRPFGAAEAGLFKEEYGYDSANFLHWAGPEDEAFESTQGRVYLVKFSGETAQPRTVVTGAELSYELPLAPGRPGFGDRLKLAANEEFWRYPNDVDVICELTMIIESDTTKVFPASFDASYASRAGVKKKKTVQRDVNNPRQRSLSAHWEEVVLPGSDLGIHFHW